MSTKSHDHRSIGFVVVAETLRTHALAIDHATVACILDDWEDATYQVILRWGDGSPAKHGSIETAHGRRVLKASHAYRSPGSYPIEVEVRRGDGLVAKATSRAVVGRPNERFVGAAFERLTGHPIGAERASDLAGRIDRGEARASVVHALLDTPEVRAALVASVYASVLGRAPTERELGHGGLVVGGDTTALAATLLGSPEYLETRAAKGPAAFAASLYRDVLGRAPTPAEASAVEQRAHDASREAAAAHLLETPEARARAVDDAARRFFGRPAAIGELFKLGGLGGVILSPASVPPDEPTSVPPEAGPDFAIQFLFLPAEDIPGLMAAQHDRFCKQLGIEPDVQASDDGFTVGVWALGPNGDPDRKKWLNEASASAFIRGQDFVGFYGAKKLLQTGADLAYAAQVDAFKARFTVKGVPDAGGPVHISRVEILFDQGANSITTRAHGFAEQRLGSLDLFDVSFTQDLVDKPGTASSVGDDGSPERILTCDSKVLDPDTDNAGAIALTIFGLLGGFWGLAVAEGGNAINAQNPQPGGAGAGYVDGIQSQHVTLAPLDQNGGKIIFNFLSAQVYDDSIIITAGAPPLGKVRTPSITVDGATSGAYFLQGGNSTPYYTIRTHDLRPFTDPGVPCQQRVEYLQVQWKALDGETTIASPNAPSTAVNFHIPSNTVAGTTVTRRFQVTVKDQDFPAITEVVTVKLFIIDRRPTPPSTRPHQRLES